MQKHPLGDGNSSNFSKLWLCAIRKMMTQNWRSSMHRANIIKLQNMKYWRAFLNEPTGDIDPTRTWCIVQTDCWRLLKRRKKIWWVISSVVLAARPQLVQLWRCGAVVDTVVVSSHMPTKYVTERKRRTFPINSESLCLIRRDVKEAIRKH